MKCHNKGNLKNSPLKHMLHMVLCCGLPIIIVGVLPFISKLSPGVGNIVLKIVPFLCPIMMISMMLMMIGSNKKNNCCSNKNNGDIDNKSSEL